MRTRSRCRTPAIRTCTSDLAVSDRTHLPGPVGSELCGRGMCAQCQLRMKSTELALVQGRPSLPQRIRPPLLPGLMSRTRSGSARRPAVPPESPTLGFTHLQFEALLTTTRQSPNPSDFALVAMLGLPGLRIFEATGADIAALGEEDGHRVLRVCGKGTKVVLIPLPPAVGRAIDRAIGARTDGPILLNSRGGWMDRHAATRRLRRLAETAGVRSWLAGLSHRDFGRVNFLVGLLAEHARNLGEPYARHLGGKVRELRFYLLRQQTRVTS